MMPFLRVAFGFALALFCGGAFAQDVNLIAANGPIALDRGQLTPKSDEAIYLNDTDGCDFLVETNGWEREGCAFVDRVMFLTTNDVDTLIVGVPDDSGYVDFADWNEPDRDDAISSIWAELQTSIADQSERLGVQIRAVRWLSYPKLDQTKGVLHYAYELNWGGEAVINIKASVFDRKGYVMFNMVPIAQTMTEGEIDAMVRDITGAYKPNDGSRYADFRVGDHVAEAGAVGVLATMVGVKYGKEVWAGILAVILAFAKKLWFLLLLPLAYLGRLFRRSKD